MVFGLRDPRCAQTAVLYKSAHAANLCAQTIRNRILKDTTFRGEVEQAKQQYVELLESEVHRRGVVGRCVSGTWTSRPSSRTTER